MHTLGRNVGLTGRIAVFEGKTLTGENPNIVPHRLRAARAESVKFISRQHTKNKKLLKNYLSSKTKSFTTQRKRRGVKICLTFISKFYKRKAQAGMWITTNTTINNLQGKAILGCLSTPTKSSFSSTDLLILDVNFLILCTENTILGYSTSL